MMPLRSIFLLTPLREGRHPSGCSRRGRPYYFYSRPCGRGHGSLSLQLSKRIDFYSRPCGRGDANHCFVSAPAHHISTHAPAGGATFLIEAGAAMFRFLLTPLREGRRLPRRPAGSGRVYFYSRPCGRGDPYRREDDAGGVDFYSRPCGRGDGSRAGRGRRGSFLLTPLREGRRQGRLARKCAAFISTHAPAGGATACRTRSRLFPAYFYSRPCGRGDELRSTTCVCSL